MLALNGGDCVFVFFFSIIITLAYFFICYLKDAALKSLVVQHGERWESIAQHLKDRSDIQCQQRWTKVVNPELIKGPWTKEVCEINLK
jgi:hypothetical protein